MSFVLLPTRLGRAYRQSKALQNEILMNVSDLKVFVKTQTGESTLNWDAFIKWKSNKHVVLLYQSKTIYNVLPRRAFVNDGDLENFSNC